jgi:hypothetical protein
MPIVRRVSKDSLAVSLHQTKVAIDAGMASHMQAGSTPPNGLHSE